jgi:predicted SprT family Zn-dependent metalloprotease
LVKPLSNNVTKLKNITMKLTYGKKNYQCKCGQIQEEYIWNHLIKDIIFKCYKCGNPLGYNNLEKKPDSIISIRTPTKNR